MWIEVEGFLQVWKQTKILYEIQKDNMSRGFEEDWKWLTSWFQDLGQRVKKLLTIIIIALLIFVYIYVALQCLFKCCSVIEKQVCERIIWDRYEVWNPFLFKSQSGNCSYQLKEWILSAITNRRICKQWTSTGSVCSLNKEWCEELLIRSCCYCSLNILEHA